MVKVFTNDPQANIRIFYYQYLKLCFELDNVNYEFYINKIEPIYELLHYLIAASFIFKALASPKAMKFRI